MTERRCQACGAEADRLRHWRLGLASKWAPDVALCNDCSKPLFHILDVAAPERRGRIRIRPTTDPRTLRRLEESERRETQ